MQLPRSAPDPRRAAEAGYTLPEMLVVLVILGAVLLGLTTSFLSATSAQVGLESRNEAQTNARIGLDRMRLDIHCSNANMLPPQPNDYGGWTLTLTETPIQCPPMTQAGVQWCTIPYQGSPTRFRLYRETSGNCDGVGATMVIDYIAPPAAGWPTNQNVSPAPASWAGNIWPTSRACPTGGLPTVAVDLDVSLDPVAHPEEGYELKDEIAERNAAHC